MDFEDITGGAGSFFKPKEHKEAVAILAEVKKFEPQKPGKFGPKDTVTADLHIFATAGDLKKGEANVIQSALINNGLLARDLGPLVNKATIVKLDTVELKTGNDGWVWRKVDDATKAAVVEYAKAYTAKVQAAMDEAPDF